ncbi:hypothetical protein THAOC_08322 [Thalassiosira oceanica]|uniref:Uncharacterized protein n=1 Tax=Thalassiosira oceanica TaxID=159749 RepID=K0SZA0_THAOC|nr:hypothetical protein THAOC_08322 [Thalassiosira oceanica]|eukprot:EJK70324.1 hypothetical protein THAOC_08322 [Thalassiosira oceanica]
MPSASASARAPSVLSRRRRAPLRGMAGQYRGPHRPTPPSIAPVREAPGLPPPGRRTGRGSHRLSSSRGGGTAFRSPTTGASEDCEAVRQQRGVRLDSLDSPRQLAGPPGPRGRGLPAAGARPLIRLPLPEPSTSAARRARRDRPFPPRRAPSFGLTRPCIDASGSSKAVLPTFPVASDTALRRTKSGFGDLRGFTAGSFWSSRALAGLRRIRALVAPGAKSFPAAAAGRPAYAPVPLSGAPSVVLPSSPGEDPDGCLVLAFGRNTHLALPPRRLRRCRGEGTSTSRAPPPSSSRRYVAEWKVVRPPGPARSSATRLKKVSELSVV